MKLLLAVLTALLARARGATVLRVTPAGATAVNDPLRFDSVHAARDALRAGLGAGTERVVSVAGDHHLAAPLELDERDSGEPGAPIRWVGAGDGRDGAEEKKPTRLSGGIAVPFASWTPYTAPGGQKGVKAELFPLGFNQTGIGCANNNPSDSCAELFVAGKPATIARSPNIAKDGTWMWYGYEAFRGGPNCGASSPKAACMQFAMRNASAEVKELRKVRTPRGAPGGAPAAASAAAPGGAPGGAPAAAPGSAPAAAPAVLSATDPRTAAAGAERGRQEPLVRS